MNISGALNLAALGGGIPEATVTALTAQHMLVDATRSRVSVSLPLWQGRTPLARLALLRAILERAATTGHTRSLTWLFSGVYLDRNGMRQALTGWKSATNPPLLFIMDVARGSGFVRTVGLSTLVSKEIEVHHEGEGAKNAIVFAIRAALHLVCDGAFQNRQQLSAPPLAGRVLANLKKEVIIQLQSNP